MTDWILLSPRRGRILEVLLREHLTKGNRLEAAVNENRKPLGFGVGGL